MNDSKRKSSDFITKTVLDIISYLVSLTPVLITWTCGYLFLANTTNNLFLLILKLITFPLFLCSIFLLCIFLLRQTFPKLEAGKHDVGFNSKCLSWFLNLSLNRATKISGLRPLFHSFYFSKYLLYRALGGNVGFGSNTSIEFVLVDVPLITMGKNCVLGEGVHISCHYFLGEKLILRPVTIGDNVFISSHCIVGPGSKIGNNSWIGYGNAIAGEELPEGSKINNFEWRLGGPKQPKPAPLQKLFNEIND